MQTIDQKYAATIYEQVLRIKDEQDYKKYGVIAHKLPILIHTAGLIQALEFVNSRGHPLQKCLLEHLAITIGQGDADTFLKAVRNSELSGYIRLNRQVLGALLWYKRFAQSILEVDATDAALEDDKKNDRPN